MFANNTTSSTAPTGTTELTADQLEGVAGGFGLLLAAVVIGVIYTYDAYQIYKAAK